MTTLECVPTRAAPLATPAVPRCIAALVFALGVVFPGPVAAGGGFIRGDSNVDGKIDIADAVSTLLALFSGGELTCRDAADYDGNGTVEITDPIGLLGYQFLHGSPPPEPFPECGPPPAGSPSLGCERSLCPSLEPDGDAVWMRRLYLCKQCEPCASLEDVLKAVEEEGISVLDAARYSPWINCLACSVCADNRYYYVLVSAADAEVLDGMGWERTEAPPTR